jgi:hypothetical protein
MSKPITRLICIGRDARMTRAIIDLDYPPKRIANKLFIIVEDSDVHLLHGYCPDELRYVPMAASHYQLDFLRVRGIGQIALSEALEWIRTQEL